jgi:predicted PurR-regulated permease PerM
MLSPHRETPFWVANTVLAILLIAVMVLHLFLALLAGLAAFALHQALLAALETRVSPRWRQPLAMLLFWLVIAAVVAAIAGGLHSLGVNAPGEMVARLTELFADSLDKLRAALPAAITEHLPASIDAVRDQTVTWLREHGAELRTWGAETLRAAAHFLVGLVIGLLASLHAGGTADEPPTFLQAWRHGLARLVRAFTGVMGAQVRIAAINTALTAVYLLGIAPLVGGHMPMGKALVAFTFFAGLIPVLGNLASNTAIVLASLLVSPTMAALSLAYLIGIHKLEYFLNARLVGGRIQARTYELLGAMLLLDAVFGLKGVVAAPIYYAWLMGVLREDGWV